MKSDEVYKELHTILFGGKRRAKAAHIKTNVLRFPGFKRSQGEDEETAKSKVKDKLVNCHRERLLEFCDIFDLPKTTKNKEDIVAKLCEFLDKPHHLQKRKKSEDHSPKPSSKRNKTEQPTKPLIMEPEYLEEKRSLQDLWKAAFPVGTHWHELDELYNKFNWDFKNLEEALEEGGLLYGKKVFLFGFSEFHGVLYKGKNTHILVPTVIAIESQVPPSDKLGITSGETEKAIPMKQMKMDWVPYIPFDKRDRQVDRMDFQIFTLVCNQRRSTLRHMKEDRVRDFGYCLPYFYNPLRELILGQSTVVNIIYPSQPPVVCEFNWDIDQLEEVVDSLIENEKLSAEQKDEFKEFVKERVRAAKRANREARAEMRQQTMISFHSIKMYKFYPLPPPDISGILKSRFINRYYGYTLHVF